MSAVKCPDHSNTTANVYNNHGPLPINHAHCHLTVMLQVSAYNNSFTEGSQLVTARRLWTSGDKTYKRNSKIMYFDPTYDTDT